MAGKVDKEPETLRIHREMYERRLRDMASRDELEGSNRPLAPTVQTEKTVEGQEESSTGKKAAYLV